MPQILTIAYIPIIINDLAIAEAFLYLLLFLVSIFGTASFGHLLNDITDLEQDQKAGKNNAFLDGNYSSSFALMIFTSFIGWLPWFFLPYSSLAISLLGFQFTLFFLYSVKPFRFKERTILGLLADASYGYFVPFAITLALFSQINDFPISSQWENTCYVLLVWAFFHGIRGIIFSQLRDRKNDRVSGTKTFVTESGAMLSLRIHNFVILPLEILFFCISIFKLNDWFNFLIIGTVLGLLYTYLFTLTLSGLKFSLKKEYRLGLSILDSFYSKFLPLIILFIGILFNSNFTWILIIHILIFDTGINEIWRNGKYVLYRSFQKIGLIKKN